MLSLLRKLFSSKKSDAEVLDPATKLWPFPPAIPAVQEPEKTVEPTPVVVAPAEPKPKRAPAAKKPRVAAKAPATRKPRAPRAQ